MTDKVKALITNYVRNHGVSLFLGKERTSEFEYIMNEVQSKNGRLDFLNTSTPLKKAVFEKGGSVNLYKGPALHWSSSIPSLEYDVVFLSEAKVSYEKPRQIVDEFWPVVRKGGVLIMTPWYNEGLMEKFEIMDGDSDYSWKVK